uniref:hypothetical protein n=1 Tax=Candidatus Cryptobacteroides bacterium TaxID=3085639 RepID=UPI0040270DE2
MNFLFLPSIVILLLFLSYVARRRVFPSAAGLSFGRRVAAELVEAPVSSWSKHPPPALRQTKVLFKGEKSTPQKNIPEKSQKKFGSKEKVRIFAARFGRSGTKQSSLTILRDYNEVSVKE